MLERCYSADVKVLLRISWAQHRVLWSISSSKHDVCSSARLWPGMKSCRLQPVGVSMVGVPRAGVPRAGVPRVGVLSAGVLDAGVPARVVPTVGRLAAGEMVLAGVLPPVGTPTGKISVLSSRFFFGFGSGAANTLSVVSSSQTHKLKR
jgi:hypothetical protein